MKHAFYPGCAHETSAGYNESLYAVCQKLEIQLIEIPDWNCCGATITAGESKTSSLYLAARTFALSEKIGFNEILTGCNACYTTLKKSANILFSDHKQLEEINKHLKAESLKLTQKITIRHIMDVIFESTPKDLWDVYKNRSLKDINIACYYGCQYTRPWLTGRASEKPAYMEDFLNSLGFNTIDHSAKTLCCGAAGAMPHADIARSLVARIADCVKKESADIIITICPLCQFNMDTYQTRPGITEIPVLFFTQLLGLYFEIESKHLGLDKLLIKPVSFIRKMKTIKSS